jgi:alginate O-acetyltransferase complex protein AlgI
MVFSSPIFLFLPCVLAFHFAVPRRLRNLLLLLASLFFYVWGEKRFFAVLLASVAVNYALALGLDRAAASRRAARLLLALAVLFNLGLLVTFKYAAFLAANLNDGLARFGLPPACPDFSLHLPLGISFFTFHALSYVIDVYRREVPALKNPVHFALYISFFPQSLAGPIVRYSDVAGQLLRRAVTREGFALGVQRFVVGPAKKVIVADAVAGPVDAIFRLPPEALTPGLAWLAVACYTLQIYFDFSGYSDMAIGLARMFGFEFRENFDHPYVARSVT